MFNIADNQNDPIYKGNIQNNTPRWITNFNSFHSFQLTNNNDPIKNLNAKAASIDQFNDQWNTGYLNYGNTLTNIFPLLVKDYNDALNIRKTNAKISDLEDADVEESPVITKGLKYLKQMSKISYKFKSTNQPVLVRNYKNGILQVKIGSQIYYDSNNTSNDDDFYPYNTMIDSVNDINSTSRPTKNDINNVVVPKDTSLYTTKGEKWYSTTMGKQGKSIDPSYIYDGNNWNRP